MVNLKSAAKSFANRSFPIGKKPNPNIGTIKKKFGTAFIERLISMKRFKENQLSHSELKYVKELMSPVYGPFIYKKDDIYHVIENVGETVRITYSNTPECKKLMSFIREEYWKRGVHVASVEYDSNISRRQLILSPDSNIAEMPPSRKAFAEKYDARIFLGGENNEFWIRGLEKKEMIGSPTAQHLMTIMDKKKMKWCYFGWPVPKTKYHVPSAEYRKIFLSSIEESFKPATKKIIDYYYKALTGKSTIRITADDGTDLTFSIKGRPLLYDDGILNEEKVKKGDVGLNVPAGELFLAPLEYSANGVITFTYVTLHGYGLAKNLKLTFKDGKVVKWESDKKSCSLFKKFLDSNTGEKDRIAELGIGTNKGAKFVGETIIDEKIFGSIHIAIGNNTGAYHGKNKASSHEDMIKIMHGHNGNVYADGKLVMKNGLPLIKV